MSLIEKTSQINYIFLYKQETVNRFDSLTDLFQIENLFPPLTLSSEDRIYLGILVLEKYGEAKFAFYQTTYRLTQEESASIFKQTPDYAKDLVSWETLNETAYQEDIDSIRSHFPKATFSLLYTREENHRSHPIVEIGNKRYYFYSQAYKGPVVDKNYIAQYQACQEQECRPDFITLPGKGEKTVFLMEFKGEKTPDFRNEFHLSLLLELIVRKSLNKKGLDMLPCRLALVDDKNLYCVDQKLHYSIFNTEIEAFNENIKLLKGKIAYRGYAEERLLFAYIDQIAKQHEMRILEKTIESLPYIYKLSDLLSPSSLNSDQKVNLAAVVLKKHGTVQLPFIAKNYQLSIEDQKKAKKVAGNDFIQNTVIWNSTIPASFEALHKTSQNVLEKEKLKGTFASYCNKAGNYKPVLTVSIDDKTFVVSQQNKDYIEQFKLQKEREHRPDFRIFPLQEGEEDSTFLFLSQFMGSQTIDYSNEQHLDMIIDLALNFSDNKVESSTIDFNMGNLLVSEGRLYYIDKDLTYTLSDNPRKTNIQGIFNTIDQTLHVEHERVKSKKHIKNKIKSLLDSENPLDVEILQTFCSKKIQPAHANASSSFEIFLSQIDFDDEDGPGKLYRALPLFFQTAKDFETTSARLVMIGEKLLTSAYRNTDGSLYYELIMDKINKLSKEKF